MIHHPMTAGRTCCSMHVLLAPLCTYNTTYHSVITMAPWGNNWTKAGCIWECVHLLQWPWPIPWGSAALARGLGQGEHWARACGFTGYWSKEIFWVEALWPMWWLKQNTRCNQIRLPPRWIHLWYKILSDDICVELAMKDFSSPASGNKLRGRDQRFMTLIFLYEVRFQ